MDDRLDVSPTLGVVGVCAVLVGAALVGLMHVVPPSDAVSPVRRTISEYALLANGWVFDLAVLVLAAGSAAVLVALLRARLLRMASLAGVALFLWTLGLSAVVVFPKHNWATGPSMNGSIHRVASLVAFLSLPVAAMLLGRAWRRHPRWRTHASSAMGLGLLSLLCFAPIGLAIVLEPVTGVRWWQAIPLGAVERALALSEVATVLALGWWSVRGSREATGWPEGPSTRLAPAP